MVAGIDNKSDEKLVIRMLDVLRSYHTPTTSKVAVYSPRKKPSPSTVASSEYREKAQKKLILMVYYETDDYPQKIQEAVKEGVLFFEDLLKDTDSYYESDDSCEFRS